MHHIWHLQKYLQLQVKQVAKKKKGNGLCQANESQWEYQILAWRDKLGITQRFNPWDSLNSKAKVRGICITERVRQILNLALSEKLASNRSDRKPAAARKHEIQKAASTLVVDISQNPCRQNFTTSKGFLHTLTTSSQLVHVGKNRIIHPVDMLYLQGHNPHTTCIPSGMKNEAVRRLAGEGMALPCVALCLWCQFVVKGFPDPGDVD